MSVLGVDVSTWQHPNGAPIDWQQVADAGYRFAIVKATQGVAYINPWFERDYDDAYAAGLLVGAYHYFDPVGSPVDQAAHFTSTLVGKHLHAHAWLDFELPYASEWELATTIREFLDEAHKARPGCGLYADGSMVDALRKANFAFPDLWLASWDLSAPPAPCSLWQDSDRVTVPGIPAEVDQDTWVRIRGVDLPTAPLARPTGAPVPAPVSTPGPVKVESEGSADAVADEDGGKG